MPMRVSETLAGYVHLQVIGDPQRRVLGELVKERVPVWDVRAYNEIDYELALQLRYVKTLLAAARRARVKIRFTRKIGLPFILWRAGRRKVFIGGAIAFVIALFSLSCFIWHVNIDGTDQPETVQAVLEKLHVYPGSLLFRVLDQDSLQLALLDKLPEISWVGVRIHGTAVYVHVIQKVPAKDFVRQTPQSIVAKVPGVVVGVLADTGQPAVKLGQYVTPGTVLISGVLEDGRTVYAAGSVQGIVWYRTQLSEPATVKKNVLMGASVSHFYLVVAGIPIQVWGFSHPPYAHKQVQQRVYPLRVGDVTLPFTWRADTVYEAAPHTVHRTESALLQQGLAFAAHDVLLQASEQAKVLRQNILQKKLEHGTLYMTVWTEVLEDIGRAQKIAAQSPASPSAPS